MLELCWDLQDIQTWTYDYFSSSRLIIHNFCFCLFLICLEMVVILLTSLNRLYQTTPNNIECSSCCNCVNPESESDSILKAVDLNCYSPRSDSLRNLGIILKSWIALQWIIQRGACVFLSWLILLLDKLLVSCVLEELNCVWTCVESQFCSTQCI